MAIQHCLGNEGVIPKASKLDIPYFFLLIKIYIYLDIAYNYDSLSFVNPLDYKKSFFTANDKEEVTTTMMMMMTSTILLT